MNGAAASDATPRRAFTALVRHDFRVVWRASLGAAVAAAAILAVTFVGYERAYPSRQARSLLADQLEANPAILAVFGGGGALDTPGGFAQWRVGLLTVALFAVVALLKTARLTAGEEQEGRLELVLAGRVTAHAATAAAVTAVLAGLAVSAGVLLAAGMALTAVGRVTAQAAVAHAALPLLAGGLACGLAALAAQIVPVRRAVVSLVGAVLALSYALRVAADSADSTMLKALSPLGWLDSLTPLSAPRPLWALPVMVAAGISTAVALALASRRDVYSGALGRIGHRRRRRAQLSSPEALALVQMRPTALAWAAGAAMLGFMFGLVAPAVPGLIETVPEDIRLRMRATGLPLATVEGYLATTFLLTGALASVFGAVVAGRMAGEERSGRLEVVLSHAVTRRRWLVSRLLAGTLAQATVLAAVALAAAAGSTIAGDGASLLGLLGGAANLLPVVLTFLALGALVFALRPASAFTVTAGVVGVTFFLHPLAAELQLPEDLRRLSPFGHLALVPARDPDLTASAVLLAVALSLAVAAVVAFDRRDLRL